MYLCRCLPLTVGNIIAYYSASKVEENGIRVEAPPGDSFPRVYLGEDHLVMVLDNGMYRITPDVTSPNDYREFYSQYYSGRFLTFDLFRLPKDKLELCADTGRKPSTYLSNKQSGLGNHNL